MIGFIVPDLALVGFGLTCASFAFGSGAEAIAAILSVTAIRAGITGWCIIHQ